MPFRFLQIPARGCKQIESEMNLFLQSHRVLTVDRRLVDAVQFVSDGPEAVELLDVT
jgi:hypothetical protein